MNINELEELAKAVPGWSNCNKAWLDTSEDVSAAVVGHINEDGECYPVITVDCDQYYSGDSLKLAKFYAAANPSAISELIAAYREAVDAIRNTLNGVDTSRRDCRSALATAKRLGIYQL
jgi:uncharacterized UBP type Zn finger protein